MNRRQMVLGSLVVLLSATGWLSWRSLLARDAIPFEGATAPVGLARPVTGLRLHVFETGRMVLPAWTVAVGASGERVMDQPAFVLEHPSRGLVMFEAGHHPDIARDPGEHLGFIHAAGLMPMEQRPGQDARTQLEHAGFDPDAVRTIIVSHFHPEHVGAVEEFPFAMIAADAREIAWGVDDPDYNYVPAEYDEVASWMPITFDDAAPFGPFPGAFDLFGDGSVLVVSTPGHTPGHVSVLVNLEHGPVLLAGDTAWTELNLRTATIGLPFVSSDAEAARASLGQLLRFRDDHPHVTIVPGHDLTPLRRAVRSDVVLHPTAAARVAAL
jgi:N-acyl homoserine lactone hydrolase